MTACNQVAAPFPATWPVDASCGLRRGHGGPHLSAAASAAVDAALGLNYSGPVGGFFGADDQLTTKVARESLSPGRPVGGVR